MGAVNNTVRIILALNNTIFLLPYSYEETKRDKRRAKERDSQFNILFYLCCL